MVRRGDRNLQIAGTVEVIKRNFLGETWRGVAMSPGSSLCLKDVRRFHPFRASPDFCGWYADLSGSAPGLTVGFGRGDQGQLLTSSKVRAGEAVPIMLKWPLDIDAGSGPLDLTIRADAKEGKGRAYLLNHRALSRHWLIALAKGRGVEIGPGRAPQIWPSDEVDVSYLEQKSDEEWKSLYNSTDKYEVANGIWERYIIREAAAIPVQDGSLDFIFSSHVFEHLANPLGHLRHWRSKLKPGGLILCIVPDLAGTKDAEQFPSELSEIIDEMTNDVWLPQLHHYRRHMRVAMPDRDPEEIMTQGRSIHVHYYNNENMSKLLSLSCDKLGFSKFIIDSTSNHKDFNFALKRD
jgi:predicted SAM-dependent methyltransferase